jgi:hypothetical protein
VAVPGCNCKQVLKLRVAVLKVIALRVFTGKPSTPSGRLRVRRLGDSSSAVVVDWSPPLDDGGARITSYIVEYRDADSVTWQRAAVVDGLTTSVTVRGLRDYGTSGGDHLFRVYAVNEYGTGHPLETDSIWSTTRTITTTRSAAAGK